jgi:transcription elongation factor
MAGSFADYLEKKLLDHVLGNTAYSAPATVYIALFTDSNTATQRDAGTVTEVSGNAYARVAVTNNTTNWPNASGTLASKSNGTTFTFPTPTGSWGTVTAYGIYDASTAGNLLVWADLDTPNTVATGNTVQFGSSGVVLTLD